LSRGNTGPTFSTPRAATMSFSGRIASTIHLD
jgi:branched-subunit amino acid permease